MMLREKYRKYSKRKYIENNFRKLKAKDKN